MRFDNQGAIVTGSSSGIGRAIALRLASEGADVLCCDLTPQPGLAGSSDDERATVDLIRAGGGSAAFQLCDAGEEPSVNAAFSAASTRASPLRIAVLNAGIFLRDVSILDETSDEHDRIMRVNERGVWLGLRAAARVFVAAACGGRIICTGSISGLVGLSDEPAYCSSKGAVVNLVRAAALDLAPHRINVNAVCPGFVATPMLREVLDDPVRRAPYDAATPWPRLGRPEDVAGAVAFLASADADWITGVALPVDGGYTAR